MAASKLIVAVMGAGVLCAPGAAFGAATIGGDTSTPAPGIAGCSIITTESCTFVQDVDPTAPVTAPFDGVIVRWRVRGNSFGAQESLRVVQAAGGVSYTGVATGPAETVLPGVENVFSASIPIQQGQGIGIDVPGAAGTPRIETRNVAGATNWSWYPTRLGDNETGARNGFTMNDQLALNATIEPDCDRDGLGDETQDDDLFSCALHTRSVVTEVSKGKVRKGKKVVLSGEVSVPGNESRCEAGQTVELQRRKLAETSFTTFAQVQSDPAGVFSTKLKMKKTSIFRAVVTATPDCTAAESQPDSVKVKRKH